jgi:hypothetical protein
MQQHGSANLAFFCRSNDSVAQFPGQSALDQAITNLQELSLGNVHFLQSVSSYLLKWATIFQRVANDVSMSLRFFQRSV